MTDIAVNPLQFGHAGRALAGATHTTGPGANRLQFGPGRPGLVRVAGIADELLNRLRFSCDVLGWLRP